MMPKDRGVEPLKLFRTFVRNLPFAKAMGPLGGFMLSGRDKGGASFDLRSREIVIDRVCARCGCEYEWGVHVSIFAKAAKLTDAQVAATRSIEIDNQMWSDIELNLIIVIDQLCKSGVVEDEALIEFQNNWSKEQQLEIIALAGAYHTVSFVANIAKLPNESFGAEFPS